LLGAPRPIGPAEAAGWGTEDGFAIHPASDVDRGAGAAWNGFHVENMYKIEKSD